MNHQCDYCHKELKRLMFCNHSHQVMYHNKGMKETKPTIKTNKIIKTKEDVIKAIRSPKGNTAPCRHGLGYCKECME